MNLPTISGRPAGGGTGFVDPVYMILVALAGVGVALAVPGVQALLQGAPLSAWTWAGLAGGAALVVACVAWFVRLK